jgi:glycosyltransferase involved in cell wall biosynthesis
VRVLHLSAGNLYGGVESLLVTLARERDLCSDMEPHFALCYEGRLSDELRASRVNVHMLGPARLSRPWMVWRVRRALRALLASTRFDVAVCHECWLHVLFAAVVRSCGVPLAFWAHDIHKGKTILERWAARTTPDLILANSRVTQASMVNIFSGVLAEVLYLPVAFPAVDRTQARRLIRTELQTDDRAVVIVVACRLERWKGHMLLLQALSQLMDLPGWVCWIAGGAQRPHEIAYLSELRQRSEQLRLGSRLRWLGQRQDVPLLLTAADIHCQPNTGPEPFGIAFVEALYAGLPVVTTAQGGPLEIVDESCGELTPPGDVQALAGVLRRFLLEDSLRNRLGACGPIRALELCDPARQFGKLGGYLAALTVEGVAS